MFVYLVYSRREAAVFVFESDWDLGKLGCRIYRSIGIEGPLNFVGLATPVSDNHAFFLVGFKNNTDGSQSSITKLQFPVNNQ